MIDQIWNSFIVPCTNPHSNNLISHYLIQRKTHLWKYSVFTGWIKSDILPSPRQRKGERENLRCHRRKLHPSMQEVRVTLFLNCCEDHFQVSYSVFYAIQDGSSSLRVRKIKWVAPTSREEGIAVKELGRTLINYFLSSIQERKGKKMCVPLLETRFPFLFYSTSTTEFGH